MWREQTPLSILDPKMKDSYLEIEVIKCVQIGLLCVQENPDIRPPMMTVITYLDNHSIKLFHKNQHFSYTQEWIKT